MFTSHTPGPWTVCTDHPASSSYGEAVIEQRGGSAPIATIHAIHTIAPGPSQVGANAHLIAAAPELLDAAHNALAYLNLLAQRYADDAPHMLDEFRGIRAGLSFALSKAEQRVIGGDARTIAEISTMLKRGEL